MLDVIDENTKVKDLRDSYLSRAIKDLDMDGEIVARNRKDGAYLIWIGDE